jgi:hypothetical protein
VEVSLSLSSPHLKPQTILITHNRLPEDKTNQKDSLGILHLARTVEALECQRSWLKITDIEIEALIREATKQREDQDIAEEVEEKSAL